MSAPKQPRGGHTLAKHQIGGVTFGLSVGHLDKMPRCAVCGRAICSHTDAEFAGWRA